VTAQTDLRIVRASATTPATTPASAPASAADPRSVPAARPVPAEPAPPAPKAAPARRAPSAPATVDLAAGNRTAAEPAVSGRAPADPATQDPEVRDSAAQDPAAQDPTAQEPAAPDPDALDPALFRSAFRRHAAGVAVITATGPGGPVGFTATSLASVAADPPLLSFGISLGASSWPALAEAPYVGVHILGDHQEELAQVFARTGADRFGPPTAWTTGPYGVPLLGGVVAWLVGRILHRVPAGDHRIVIAQAVAGDPGDPGRPLLYHEGGFRRLGP
jgi:flavin reductase (DIM6/NTAB) family NADH-FMN oxidoreductase RutF